MIRLGGLRERKGIILSYKMEVLCFQVYIDCINISCFLISPLSEKDITVRVCEHHFCIWNFVCVNYFFEKAVCVNYSSIHSEYIGHGFQILLLSNLKRDLLVFWTGILGCW